MQTKNKDELSYAPPAAQRWEEVRFRTYFRINHYSEVQDVPHLDNDYLKLLNSIGEMEALVVKIIDSFDFTGSWIPGLHRYAGDNPVLLVGNKMDVLPKSTNKNRLKDWMRRSAKE